jgi:putative mRNA 3-end processing factor
MKFIFHGGAHEVGRSCIEVKGSSNRILFDAGLQITSHGSQYPVNMDALNEIDAVFLSHAHLDHCGALPLFDFAGLHCPIFLTPISKDIIKILLKDSYRLGRLHNSQDPYHFENIKDVFNFTRNVKKGIKGTFKDMEYEFFDAGHIPGSSSVLLKMDGKSILYTGDLKLIETQLFKGADTNYGPVDVMICESTYGNRVQHARKETEKKFLDAINNTLKQNGSIIISAFAVGRAQEILALLAHSNCKAPVYLDGMAKSIIKIVLNNSSCVKDIGILKKFMKRVKLVKGHHNRMNLCRNQGIFITTSGMLTGGPVIDYIKYMHHNPKNLLMLTGYQGPNTNGKTLLETGYMSLNGYMTKIHCQVEKFEFSAHADQDELKTLVRKVKPKHLIIQHGDADAIAAFEEWATHVGFKTYSPKLGDSIEII